MSEPVNGICPRCLSMVEGQRIPDRSRDFGSRFEPGAHDCKPIEKRPPAYPEHEEPVKLPGPLPDPAATDPPFQGRRGAVIKKIRPDVCFDTSAFLAKVGPDVPPRAPVMLVWVNDDGSVEFCSNECLRRDWAWMALHLQQWAFEGPK